MNRTESVFDLNTAGTHKKNVICLFVKSFVYFLTVSKNVAAAVSLHWNRHTAKQKTATTTAFETDSEFQIE